MPDTVLQIILRQFNASTRLVETFFISVPGKVSKINPKFSLSLACRSIKLSKDYLEYGNAKDRKEVEGRGAPTGTQRSKEIISILN